MTQADYDLYCHYVAGLVGIGLSSLFAGSGLEGDEFLKLDDLSNCMGLFLQKTNIIRDYLEARVRGLSAACVRCVKSVCVCGGALAPLVSLPAIRCRRVSFGFRRGEGETENGGRRDGPGRAAALGVR